MDHHEKIKRLYWYRIVSFSYTRLGHIIDKTPEEMCALLSNGDVTITLSME
jgi:hypothetical protein